MSDAEFVVTAVAVLGGLATLVGLVLTTAARRLPPDPDPLVARIEALLPQTQCAQCGHPGCRPYAKAVAAGGPIDACPPGGAALVAALAALLGRSPGVDPGRSHAGAPATAPAVAIARIDESACIGCALCLPACPVDAIVGAPRFLHTVLEAECTGCGLCLPPCPVSCIRLEAPDPTPRLRAAPLC